MATGSATPRARSSWPCCVAWEFAADCTGSQSTRRFREASFRNSSIPRASEILHSWVEVDLGDGWVNHRQNFGFVRDLLYRHVIRHWMNARVRRIRRGILPPVPGFDRPNHRHEETNRAA